jgi:hypothetical protein
MIRTTGNGSIEISKVLACLISIFTLISVAYGIGITIGYNNTIDEIGHANTRIEVLEKKNEQNIDRLARIETKVDLILQKVK